MDKIICPCSNPYQVADGVQSGESIGYWSEEKQILKDGFQDIYQEVNYGLCKCVIWRTRQ